METCFLALSFLNNILTLDQYSLTLVNFILTLENLGPRVNDSWDSDPSENPVCVCVCVCVCDRDGNRKVGKCRSDTRSVTSKLHTPLNNQTCSG